MILLLHFYFLLLICGCRRVVLPMWGRPINDEQVDGPANVGSSYEG
ncbi:hypothetical protein LINPERHAP1_LOCUS5160, partial [Linum perenne]